MFGRTVEEFCRIGRTGIIDLTDPRLSLAIEERNRTGKFIGELIGVRSDGSKFPLEITSAFFKGKNSRTLISSIIRDVTDRKKAEEALRRSEIKYRRLHETIRDGFVFVAMTGEIRESNEAYQKMIGYNNEELKKLSYLDITPKKWYAYENSIVTDQILIKGYSEIYEKEYIRKDGTVFPVELRTVLIKNDAGENEGMWAIVRDISDRKKAEEALKNSENQLRELNAAKDKLFSIIAHDLRNPFTAIMGYCNILSARVKENNYEDIIKYARIIQDSSQKSLRLLTNIMEWARSQYYGMTLNLQTLNVVEIIRAVANLLSDSAKQKKIDFDFEMPPQLQWCVDKHLISSVLSNLLTNAVKFSQPGGRIVISAGQEENYLVVSVKDDGIGIKKEDLNKLFRIEEYIQIPDDQYERGTGLGLILCKEFIDKHGGKIWVESEEGRGSTFYFSLPECLEQAH
jgi:PAS domain S-box-containing protein